MPDAYHGRNGSSAGRSGRRPEYSFGDCDLVGLVRVRAATPTDDGLERADLCPACGSPLHDVDDLTAREKIPRFDSDIRAMHANWRAEVKQ